LEYLTKPMAHQLWHKHFLTSSDGRNAHNSTAARYVSVKTNVPRRCTLAQDPRRVRASGDAQACDIGDGNRCRENKSVRERPSQTDRKIRFLIYRKTIADVGFREVHREHSHNYGTLNRVISHVFHWPISFKTMCINTPHGLAPKPYQANLERPCRLEK